MARNKPRRVVIFLLFRIFAFFIYLLPLKAAIRAGRVLGALIFNILKRERQRALDNLDMAFGDSRTDKDKRAIAKRAFENLAKNFVEVISLGKLNRRNIDAYIRNEGLGVVEDLIRQKKGGIVLSAHFGNWELLAHYFAIKGYSVNVIARRVRMGYFERFLDGIRRRNKVNILYRDESAKEALALLKKNEFVGMMPDQDMDSVSGVFVDFFGKKAYTPNGPAILNILTGAPIIPCFIVRQDWGHKIIIERPLELSSSGDRDKDILENTQRYTRVIEDYIRRFPCQWVWFHLRWKTKQDKRA